MHSLTFCESCLNQNQQSSFIIAFRFSFILGKPACNQYIFKIPVLKD